MIIMCYKNWYFQIKNFQRIMTVFVAADRDKKCKSQNTNVPNPNTKNAPPSPKAPTPNPQSQKSVWHFIHWRFVRGIQSGYCGSVRLKDGTCSCIAAIFCNSPQSSSSPQQTLLHGQSFADLQRDCKQLFTVFDPTRPKNCMWPLVVIQI